MSPLFLDILHDLRQKKLLPVAAVLGLAMILTPIFLLASAEDERPAPTPLPTVDAGMEVTGVPPVALEDATEHPSSNLTAFGRKDPFKRPSHKSDREKVRQAVTQLGQAVGEVAQDAFGTGLAAGIGETSTSLSGASIGSSSGGSDPFGSTGSTGGSTTGAPPSATPGAGASPKPSDSKPQLYTYRVDLEFGTGETPRKYEKVKRLAPFPGEDRPYVIFLGASEDGTEAVFLIDTEKFQVTTKGDCEPSPENCSFLRLSEETGTDQANSASLLDQEGNRYTLRVLDIELERARDRSAEEGGPSTREDDKPSSGAQLKHRPASADGARATRRRHERRATRLERHAGFLFPNFFDLLRR